MERDLRQVYEGRLFYGKDAFEGLHTMDRLMELKRSGAEDADFGRALGGRNLPPRMSERAAAAVAVDLPTRSPVGGDGQPSVRAAVRRLAGRQGASPSTTSPPTSTRPRCSATSGATGPEVRRRPTPDFKDRIRPTLRDELAKARAGGILLPAVAYGYFAANSEGDDLVIWKDETRTAEWLRFSFPRQQVEP